MAPWPCCMADNTPSSSPADARPRGQPAGYGQRRSLRRLLAQSTTSKRHAPALRRPTHEKPTGRSRATFHASWPSGGATHTTVACAERTHLPVYRPAASWPCSLATPVGFRLTNTPIICIVARFSVLTFTGENLSSWKGFHSRRNQRKEHERKPRAVGVPTPRGRCSVH
jgi:hypothetical protein